MLKARSTMRCDVTIIFSPRAGLMPARANAVLASPCSWLRWLRMNASDGLT
jgi:transaldolase